MTTSPAGILVFASATVLFTLGLTHLVLTFRGDKLRPRDRETLEQMQASAPGISRQTTMWKAWLGFNASHSLGAMLFGAVYGYLALVHGALLFGSHFLSALGGITLVAYAELARRYWFHVPRRAISLALLFYAIAQVVAR